LQSAAATALAMTWTARLLAGSIAVQASEMLVVRRAFGDDGPFVWRVARERGALDRVLTHGFIALQVAELMLALLLSCCSSPWVVGPLFVCALLTTLRFRGGYNGGSDAMTIVVLLGLTVATLARELGANDVWQRVGLGYIAAQLVLSYFVAGCAKLRDAAWRQGDALGRLVRTRQYAVPSRFAHWLSWPLCSRVLGTFVVLFELATPLVFVEPHVAYGFFAVSAGFHLAIAIVLGLNRFVWAWLAAYPALWLFTLGNLR